MANRFYIGNILTSLNLLLKVGLPIGRLEKDNPMQNRKDGKK
jgi:hypothetical protein